jgi:DNA polymerase-3 subunit beta
MKFEVSLQDISGAVGIVSRFIERRANLPVLASVLVVAEHGKLLLRATNLECGVEMSLPAKVEEEGVVAVPGLTFAGFLNNARGKNVRGVLTGEVLKLQGERVVASIKTLPHEDFPTLPHVSASSSFTVRAGDIIRALRSVVYCASISTVKPELQSVLLRGEGGRLTTAATDSFRLAEKIVPLRKGSSVSELLIPARNTLELIRILEMYSGDVEFYYNENQISTHVGDIYYTSRLIDGAFPNYRQILPKSFTTEAVVLREDMVSALKSLTIFTDKFLQVSLVIEPQKKVLTLSSHNPDVGEERVELRATISGDTVAMNFNSKYLADSLTPIVGESVRIYSNGPGKPLLIRDAADDSFLYLAMPMNR